MLILKEGAQNALPEAPTLVHPQPLEAAWLDGPPQKQGDGGVTMPVTSTPG